jgi:hypothetical protein
MGLLASGSEGDDESRKERAFTIFIRKMSARFTNASR